MAALDDLNAALDAAAPNERSAIAARVVETAESADERSAIATQAVKTAESLEEKKEIVTAAVDALTPKERHEVVTGLIPQESADRKAVYLAGFIVSAVLALGLAGIAWGAANTGNDGIGTAAIAAALSLPSAIIGGLLGAYAGRS